MVGLFLVLLGLVVGSFLGALTWRLVRGLKISQGRSFCPRCKKKIAWYDNIPLVSFVLLKGRCRHCRGKISWRYPLIEAVSAFLFFFSFKFLSLLKINLSPLAMISQDYLRLVLSLILFSLLITVFVIDLEQQIVPDQIVLPGWFFSLIVLTLFSPGQFFSQLLTGLTAALFLLLVHLLTSGKGMGLGDVKLVLFLATWLDWRNLLVWFFLAFLTGAITGSILVIAGKLDFKQKIAFGPFLVLAFVVVAFWGHLFQRLILSF